VAALVGRFKYEGSLAAGAALADRLRAHLRREPPGMVPECLVPVPLHPSRLRSRGFDQALEIARILAPGIGVTVRTNLVRRGIDTAPQSRQDDRQARRRNLRGAFRWCGPLPAPARIAVVDDVVTTGTTVLELARCLRGAGVEHVEAWSVACTPAPQD
jgi:ComF family protein